MTDVDIKFDTELSSSSSLSSLTCVELVGRWAEQHSVRHLCPNQCFLRAFAPIREWMVLRKKLEKYTPIGEILNDWTCRLVFDDKTTETETEEENQNTSTNDIEIPVNIKSPSSLSSSSRVQTAEERKQNSKAYTNQLTEFVSLKSGKTFSSFEKGRKFLFREREAPQTCIDTLDNDSSIFATTNNNNNNKSTTTIMTGNRNLIGSTTMTTAVVGRLATDDTTATTATTASPFGLLEELFSEHPWRLLISTILLNKTKRNQNIDRILFRLFQRWPTVESVVKDANNDEEAVRDYIFNQVRITGLGRNKSKAFVQLSRDFLLLITTKNQNKIDLFVPYCQYTSTTATNTTTTCTSTSGSTAISPIIRRREVEFDLTRKEVKNISNCGDYAADAFQIFIRKDLDLPIISNDYILVAYVEWKRSLDI
ncbi:hypothetical protein FRACYDRAFT_232718 [Fragilariopsis cylindrus CCMP1102]|uniref:HhH-GPD domain-containing protein n=1 Tax=Fragilariopsis cylindrus CCMP1102 TaxID=635003 RepID=A0A1E7FWL8_9STRA|nr:hypothetical protein FRACYDRAFT_232718 [Fragilariopsis cylindrus CCMP1102]|eukprot:OEU22561.1 hypothetical protein FRACYDRAFT_232718 [Fragilariopsis cylindrus CCMP1102]